MPRGPRGEKRPSNVFACAMHVMKIGMGEIEEVLDTPEQRGARAMGHKAGSSSLDVIHRIIGSQVRGSGFLLHARYKEE